MKKQEIRAGVVLRVINSHGIGAPRHALAMVETVETARSGDWLCTIRYHEQRKGKRQYPISGKRTLAALRSSLIRAR